MNNPNINMTFILHVCKHFTKVDCNICIDYYEFLQSMVIRTPVTFN